MAAVSPVARAQGIAPLAPPRTDAFAALYARHVRQVYGFCLKWLRSREEAEDAVQTTFMYAWRGLERGIVPTSEAAWMLAIARNVCRSATDARKRRSAEIARDPHVIEDTAGAAPTQETEIELVYEALADLTDLQRRALVMREWQGLSYKEIADELDLTQSAVETLLFRARRSLARKLKRLPAFTPWMKSLLAGSVAKIAAGASIVVIGTAAGTVATRHHSAPSAHAPVRHVARVVHTAAPTPAVTHVVRATHARRSAAHHVFFARRVVGTPVVPTPTEPVSATPTAPVTPTAASPPRAADPTPAPAAPPAATAPAATKPAPTSVPPAQAPSVPPAVAGAVGTVTDTVDAAVGTVTTTAGDATDAAAGVVQTVTTTAQDTAQTVVNTVTTVVPKKLLP
jgi:RNA polymerase sigma-70 factor, ECF subfamily